MHGPAPKGSWAKLTGRNVTDSYDFLHAGGWYRVKKEFTDASGERHPVGETWIFVGAAFMHYDDVYCFCVSPDGEREWQFHMMCDPGAQGPILRDLHDYIGPATAPQAPEG